MSLAPSTELRALLALHLVPGIGSRLTSALLERFGSAAAALEATAAQLQEVPHIGANLSQTLSFALRQVDPAAELELMDQQGVGLLVRGGPDFPPSLQDIPDPPHLLYLRGTLLPSDARAVALVGSRQFTSYGRRVAESLAGDLAR